MEENNIKNNPEVIDLRVVAKKIWSNRRLFYKVLPIVFVLSCIYIFSLPRVYRSSTKLAPELDNSSGKGALGSIASSLGFDISDMQTSDAITPLLYPDLMEDNGFIASLLKIELTTNHTTYFNYIANEQKKPWWSSLTSIFKKDSLVKDFFSNPYELTKKQDGIVSKVREDISINVNSKTGVITISALAQDPYISKELTDSVKEKLQEYITTYRTNKARADLNYYKKLTAEAKRDYERARQLYASSSDASTRVSLKSVELRLEDLENDMQLKFNAYTNLNSQMQAANAKVQERTPAFSLLKGASVPIKPDSPKRMIFVLVVMIIASLFVSIWILRKDIGKIFV